MAIKIKKNEEKPETTEILAEAIIKISNAIEKLSKESGLSEYALRVLIQDNCVGTPKPSKRVVEIVLKSMETLKGYYLRN